MDIISFAAANRAFLFKIFDEIAEKNILFVGAPAGYGKTAAVHLWAERRKYNTAWLFLDEYDNNITSFCKRVCGALLKLQPDNEKIAEIIGAEGFDLAAADYLISASEEFREGGIKNLLVLDDFHYITNEKINFLINYFMKRLEKNVNLVFISRKSPPAEFSELILKDKLVIVDIEDMRFSPKIISGYFEIHGYKITEREAEEIYRKTGGWPLAVNAVMIAEDKGKGKVNVASVDSFIRINLWSTWSKEKQKILIEICPAEEVTVEFCRHMCGIKDSEKILDELVFDNVFMRFQNENLYVFHDVIRDFLIREMESRGEEFCNEIQRKAGEWFYSERDYYKAIECFRKCGDIEMMESSIKKAYNVRASYASVPETFKGIKEEVSQEKLKSYPSLLRSTAWAGYLEGNLEEMTKYLDLYNEIYNRGPLTDKPTFWTNCIDPRKSLIEYTKNVKIDFEKDVEYTSPSITQNFPIFHRSARDFSEYALDTGEGYRYLEQTIGKLMKKNEYAIMENSIKAGLLYEQGALSAAKAVALTAIAEIGDETPPEYVFSAYTLYSAILMAMRNYAEAEKISETINQHIHSTKAYYLRANFRALLARRKFRENGNPEDAKKWLDYYEFDTFEKIRLYESFMHFTAIRAYIVLKDYDRAQIFLKKMLKLTMTFKRPLGIIESKILLAIVLRKQNEDEDAIKELYEAVEIAYKYNYVTLFATEGAEVVNMLYKLYNRATRNGGAVPEHFLKKLYLLAFEETKHTKGLSGGRPVKEVKLSKMQKKVMELMRDGYSYTGISEKLGIKYSTVRSHIEATYKKLDVTSAVDALSRISEQGLLE